MKKYLVLFLSLILSFAVTIPVFASESDLKYTSKTVDIVEKIETGNASSSTGLDSMLKDQTNDYGVESIKVGSLEDLVAHILNKLTQVKGFLISIIHGLIEVLLIIFIGITIVGALPMMDKNLSAKGLSGGLMCFAAYVLVTYGSDLLRLFSAWAVS